MNSMKPADRSARLRQVISAALLAAMAVALMFFEFPLSFLAPPFYKLDLSEVPVLIGSFALGPWWAAAIELLKNLLKLVLKSTETGGVGEIANFLIGCALVLPAGVIYRRHKTRGGAVAGMAIGAAVLLPVSALLNALVLLPVYATVYGMPIEMIVAMGTEINPLIDGLWTFALLAVVPFNLFKAIVCSILTYFLYKPLSAVIHGRIGQ